MKIHRLLGMTYYMLNHKHSTAEELAEKFGVSKRTVYRDIETLCEAGLPLYTTQGTGGGIHLMESYRMDCNTLTETEFQNVLRALEGTRHVDPRGQIATIADKLSANLRAGEPRTVAMDFSPMDWTVPDDMEGKWQQLHDAIQQNRRIAMTYVNNHGILSERTVEPMTLVFRTASWYLYSYCMEREDYRLFKLSRMVRVMTLRDRFARREREWDEGFFLEGNDDTPMIDLHVRVDARCGSRAIDLFHIHNITFHEDGSLEAKVRWPDDGYLLPTLLQFGSGVEVLSPNAIRERLAKVADQILTKYNVDKGKI